MFFDRLFNALGEQGARDLVTIVFLSLGKDSVIDLMELFGSSVADLVKIDSEHGRLSTDSLLAIGTIRDLVKLEKKFKKCAGDIYQ